MKAVNIQNKRARFEYNLLDKYVAGLQLSGTEIKSIRNSKVNLSDSFCSFLVLIDRADGGTSIDAKNEQNGAYNKPWGVMASGPNLTAKPSFLNCNYENIRFNVMKQKRK